MSVDSNIEIGENGDKSITTQLPEKAIVNDDKEKDVVSSKDVQDKDEKQDQEFIFIHDTGFSVRMVAPGVEPFDIQVSVLIHVV